MKGKRANKCVRMGHVNFDAGREEGEEGGKKRGREDEDLASTVEAARCLDLKERRG